MLGGQKFLGIPKRQKKLGKDNGGNHSLKLLQVLRAVSRLFPFQQQERRDSGKSSGQTIRRVALGTTMKNLRPELPKPFLFTPLFPSQ